MGKYILTNETIECDFTGKILHRIMCVSNDFKNAKFGELGGFVESEDDLSQYGDCWVFDDSTVQNSRVTGNAEIRNGSVIIRSDITDNVTISNSHIEQSRICDDSICNESSLYSVSDVMGKSLISNTLISCFVSLCDAKIGKTSELLITSGVCNLINVSVYKSILGEITISCSEFICDILSFREKVFEFIEYSKDLEREVDAFLELIKIKFGYE